MGNSCDPVRLTHSEPLSRGPVTNPELSAAVMTLVPDLVAQHAALNPEGIAVTSGAQILSYRELEQSANRLAHVLQSKGAGRDTLVATYLERSPAAVVAQLAVLKAGGAYLPLDPEYPAQRVSFMLHDARPVLILSHRRRMNHLSPGPWTIVDVDEYMNPDGASLAAPPCGADVNSLAYVIYTSGSTGQPKGVQITHGALLNLINWHQRAFAVTPSDRATHMASVAFDAAVWEIWSHLAGGCSIHIPDDHTRIQPELLREWIVTQGITITFVPTPLAERLLGLPWPAETRLRVLLTGADVLHAYPSPQLPFVVVNNYGPTETAVVATSGTVSPIERPDVRPTIGKPIANVYIRILDEDLREVRQGEAGEIYIGGAGVGRGYLGQDELTQRMFIRDPFSSNPESRLYRTGDLGRYLTNGDIAFMGRVDDLIKMRGYRIDPNEIVTLLNTHPAVQSSTVIADTDGNGDARLVAYVVAQPGSELSDSNLRGYLAIQLPSYMIPAAFVRIEVMPLTTNGKIDRSMLPAATGRNILHDEAVQLPRTTVEARLIPIVANLLQRGRVGVEENFFYIGGHSLLGTQLIGRIREDFGVDLPLRSIFDCPTIAQLAREIENAIVAKLEGILPQPGSQVRPVPPGTEA